MIAALAILALGASASTGDWTRITPSMVHAKGWPDGRFGRLPLSASHVVDSTLWSLSQHTAGEYLRFRTNASAIRVRAYLSQGVVPTGSNGFAVYQGGTLLDRFEMTEQDASFTMFLGTHDDPEWYTMYLPLYNGIQRLDVAPRGPDHELVFEFPGKGSPVVYYGTSITQGACASEPGMSVTAILGRLLKEPVVNLGFSGNGKCEVEMAQIIATLHPLAVIVDCLPNLTADQVRGRVGPFVAALGKTPVYLVDAGVPRDAEKSEALRAATLPGTTYINIGPWPIGSTTGPHLTDVGMWLVATRIYEGMVRTSAPSHRP